MLHFPGSARRLGGVLPLLHSFYLPGRPERTLDASWASYTVWFRV